MHTLAVLFSVFLSSVCGDADADAYYSEGYFGTVYQGPYAYQASTPTHTIIQPKSNPIHGHALGHAYGHSVFAAPAANYEGSPVYPGYSAPVAAHTSYIAPVAAHSAYTAPVATHTAYSAPVVPSYVSHNNYGSPEAVVVAAPEYESSVAAVAVKSSVPSVTSSQFHSQDEAGNFAFGYNNVNGAREESGNIDTGVTGSYTGAHGLKVNYVADTYGFRVV